MGKKILPWGQELILHPLKKIASADPEVRNTLYIEFCRQNKVGTVVLANGGNFLEITALEGVTSQLAEEVKELFARCYKLLGHNTNQEWFGYEVGENRRITKASYKEDFCSGHHPMVVCPYCDGDIGTIMQ